MLNKFAKYNNYYTQISQIRHSFSAIKREILSVVEYRRSHFITVKKSAETSQIHKHLKALVT